MTEPDPAPEELPGEATPANTGDSEPVSVPPEEPTGPPVVPPPPVGDGID